MCDGLELVIPLHMFRHMVFGKHWFHLEFPRWIHVDFSADFDRQKLPDESSTTAIEKPTPQISMPSIPQLSWSVPIISSAENKLKRMKMDEIKELLSAKNIGFDPNSNANKSDNDSAHDMLNELNDMANKGELEFEIIPRLETIQNWIARYSSACKREMADIVLQREEQRRQNSHLYDDIIF
ncbi:unnamed protein product [Rhizophagus irregularis]|uniref:Uncharacterized protein n=1 Tax=Rhizophagus irregularis TaxID=588596 RepID=A0A915YXN1_9GLOM|nr:unnamed protein product [Rhizophagus irregularis]